MNEVPVSILVVDDNPANRMALIAALAPLGLQIVEAGSGRAGLRELLAHDFAAVLLDINLPDMNGYEIAELVRKRPRNTHTPILFVTAERDADVDRERGYASGAVDYLVVPVVPATLRAKVTVYVDQYRAHREALELSDRFAALVQVGLDFAGAHERIELMELCCRAVQQIFETRYAGVVVTERVPEGSRRFAAIGLDDATRVRVAAEIDDCPAAGQALRQHGPDPPAICAGSVDIVGLPASHPPVTRLLACGIAAHDKTIGWMYAADRADAGTFTAADARVMMTLAAQFGTAWDSLGTSAELARLVGERTQQLEQSNGELEAFAYSVSHDLRTPLRAIDGFSQILLKEYEDKLDTEGQRILRVVRDGATKMGHLIDDILAFSRVGRQAIALAKIDMGSLVQDSLRDLASEIADRGIEVQVGKLPLVRGDRQMLQRVWSNLLENAIKFSGAKPNAVIEVGARASDAETEFFVKDSGVGFDMRFAGKLFGVFQRLHSVEEFPGTGIGLAIVHRIVTRHGGRVRAEGKVGEGATFWFTLPHVVADHA